MSKHTPLERVELTICERHVEHGKLAVAHVVSDLETEAFTDIDDARSFGDLIVRAVNAHEALVEALEISLSCLRECATYTREGLPYRTELLQQQIRAALKLARGES